MSRTISTVPPTDALESDAADAPSGWMAQIGILSRPIALLAAWLATCGSLFFSEVLGWTPCVLCWYQRILMYPLSIILAIGLLRRDQRLHLYVLPFSVFGAGVSLYHYLLQKTTWLPPPTCAVGVPCTTDYINLFGFVTIPFLALTAFLIIAMALLASSLIGDAQQDDVPSDASSLARFGSDRLAVVSIIGIVVLWFIVAARLIV